MVCFDVAIVISFLLSFYFLAYYERLDQKEINQDTLTTEDFAVVIKTLPKQSSYNSIPELKASLWNHLENVLHNEAY